MHNRQRVSRLCCCAVRSPLAYGSRFSRGFCSPVPSSAEPPPLFSTPPNFWPPPPPTRRIAHHHAPSTFPSHSPASYFHFEILHQSKKSRARVGRIHTPHGVVDTPGFVSVATNGVLKHISTQQAQDISLQMMFSNTYHLLLHPGPEVIRAAGGLHSFANFPSTIITDSGGFQAFSMLSHEEKHGDEPLYSPKHVISTDHKNRKQKPEKVRDIEREKRRANLVHKISEEGVWFKSYRDGRLTSLTPESSVDYQKDFGADIIIPLDELPPPRCEDRERLRASLHRTHRWEARSLLRHLQDPRKQAMYCVVHGGTDREMRQESVNFLTSLPFDGTAIGGNVGKDKAELLALLDWLTPQLHVVGRPIHLLGIGDLSSVRDCVSYGIDTFDSCYPTRVGRHGTIFTRSGPIQITKAIYKSLREPLQVGCTCPTCTNHTTDYIHHLFKAHEAVGLMLASIHNLHFILDYFREMRELILRDEL